MQFPFQPPWSTILTVLSLWAMAYLGMWIERHRWLARWQQWNECDEDDFEPPGSLVTAAVLKWFEQYGRYGRGYARIRRAIYYWWHGLVPVPPGSIRIISFFIGQQEQLAEPVPSEIFSADLFTPRLCQCVQAGAMIRLTFANTSRLKIPVQAMALCRLPDGSPMVPLPFPSLELLPDSTAETSARPVRSVTIDRLLLSVPPHLPKP